MVHANPEHAEIARQTIAADGELKPLKITKEYEVVGSELCVTVTRRNPLAARRAHHAVRYVGTFLPSMLQIVAVTVDESGPRNFHCYRSLQYYVVVASPGKDS